MRWPCHVSVAVLAGCWPVGPEAPPPSLLLITLEGAPAERFAPWGGADHRLDDFADAGTTFLRAYAPTPQLQPNLATTLTGLDVHQHGVRIDGAYLLDDAHSVWLESARDVGYTTATATGTQRTDDRWGFHQGSDHTRVLDEPDRLRADGDEVLSGLGLGGERQAAWVHVRVDDLPALADWLPRWVDEHPDSLIVLAGVEGSGDGVALDDASLRLPLIVVGPGFVPGEARSDVVGLTDVAPTLRAAAGAPTDGNPLQQGGSGVVLHASYAGRAALGLADLEGRTTVDGRYVHGTAGRWYGALGDRIPADGHAVPATHPSARAHETAHRALGRVAAPRRLSTAYELYRLAVEAPLVLADPETPAGSVDPRDAADRPLRLGAAVTALHQQRHADVERLLAGDPLQFTPAGRLIAARSARGQARFDGAAAALEAAHGTWTGTLWALLRAELALDRCRVGEALVWAESASLRSPDAPALLGIVARGAAVAPDEPELRALGERLIATHPNHPLAAVARGALDPAPRVDVRGPNAADVGGPLPFGVELFPRPWSPLFESARAQALWSSGRADAAIDVQRRAVSLDPFACPARVTLARWLAETGDRAGAVRLLAPIAPTTDDPAIRALWDEVQLTPEDRERRRVDRLLGR